MTIASAGSRRAIRRQRRLVFTTLFVASTLLLIVAGGGILGLRINTTPSEPLGLWRIMPLSSPVHVGQIVFICPPDNQTMREARDRGYLRAGLCNGGFGPLIKSVIAVAGQRVEVADLVTIDGVEVAGSHVVERDGDGRGLQPDRGGILPPGTVYLHSRSTGSWDSRYFGPLPAAGILGLAQEVLTYAP